jgi:uncharacterized protein RhaS with RHS repeats
LSRVLRSGPFTQRDPIGLAGGINQYGYVGGDPVNYADPFGLCPIPIEKCPAGTFTALGMAIGAFLGGTGGGALGLAGGPAGLVVAPTLSAAAAAQGAAVGSAIGATLDALVMAAKAAQSGGDGRTAGEIIAQDKKGSINREFPSEMRDKTLEEIRALAREGNRAANTAKKLLTDLRFNK